MMDWMGSLKLPRYGLVNYLDPAKQSGATSTDKRIFESLSSAGKRLMGFCRSNFMKRMDSSGVVTVNRTWDFVLDQGPLMSSGTYYAKRVWGYAPIEDDGSCYFEVPALKEIYLQLVDAEGREIQRMTSAINVMPGERQGCAGCHENRRTAAAPAVGKAARRAPTPITLPEWGNAGVLDYRTVVQPVFDRHCVKCHSGPNPPKGVSLNGNFTRFFCMSYDCIVNRSDANNQAREHFSATCVTR